MKYKTDCPCYSEVYIGNPGGVPHCSHFGLEPDCENCKRPKRTKADCIRAMTDEELAKKISGIEQFALTTDGAWSPEKWLDWLRQEAGDET